MKILLLSLTLGFSWISIACDNCNIYLNLSPNDYRNSIGVFTRQRTMFGTYDLFGEMIATKHAGHGNDTAFWGENVYETYQTIELRGNFYFREKWKTTVVLPFINNSQQIGDVKRYQINGIGDPMLIESYQLFNTLRDTGENNFSQRMTIGIGLKLPLGKTNLTYTKGTPNIDLQPGSGSWDFLSYIAYTAKYKFIGTNLTINLKRNGIDQTNYRYGNTTSSTVNLFTDLNLKKATLRVLCGGHIEKFNPDLSYEENGDFLLHHTNTGGKILYANTSIQLYSNRFVIFGEYQYALKNQLNVYTQLLTRNKINAGITYSFN